MSHTASCLHDGHPHDEAEPISGAAAGGDRRPAPAATTGPAAPRPSAASPSRARRAMSWLAVPEIRWAVVSVVGLVAALLARAAGAPSLVTGTFFAVCYVAGGWEPGLEGLRALRERRLDVDLLMIVAALGAAAIGQASDGGLLIVIFATSGTLETLATKRTREAVRSLLSLAPEQATVLRDDGTEDVVDAASIVPGDLVLVRPGERLGADGVVVAGASEVDQASITGEPLPVTKTVGSPVFAGTLNGTGALQVRAERAAADSVVARIVALVDEASETKSQTQLFIESVEQRYSVAVVLGALALFVVPLVLGSDLDATLLRAMTFMIVASPCAPVLATMPPLLSSIANAGRHGVLVKSAVVMEQLGRTRLVAFDKTGTLTEGTPRVAELELLPGVTMSEDDVLALAAGAERPSEHPLARAVVAAAADRGLAVAEAVDFSSRPGRGVAATVAGRRVEVSSPVELAERPDDTSEAGHAVERLQTAGRTAVVVTIDGTPVAVLGLADRLRPGATAAVAQLESLTGQSPVLLTGDNAGAASRLAAEVGITDVRAGLLPADKVTAVHELESSYGAVTVVGDGVNDAPALAAASTGVAMGGHGSDLALETADAVIVGDDLATVPAMITLSRRARRVVNQNLIFAFSVIVILVTLDLFGRLPLPLGVAGHEGSTVVVGLNGLRLLSRRAWQADRDMSEPG